MSQPSRYRSRFTLVAATAVLACASAAPASAIPAAHQAVSTGPAVASAAGTTAGVPAATPVFLVNGVRLQAQQGQAGGVAIAMAAGSGPSSLMTLESGGQVLTVPTDLLPYLGHGLDPSLFNLAALRHAEAGGRLPLQVTFTGQRPALPGVTISGSGRGYLDGYLTGSGARTFGAALARQYASDVTSASYGRDGLFSGGTRIALPDPSGPSSTASPASTTYTLTISATNLQGHPDTGDFVVLHNEDNPALLGHGAEIGTFNHGFAKFTVPAGHYWATGVFTGDGGKSKRLVVLPQFTVQGASTVHMAERAASSKIAFTTPRPAALQLVQYTVFRGAGNGALAATTWTGQGITLWVSPTTRKPSVGFLRSQTTAQLTSPPDAAGTPYAYSVGYLGRSGIIPPQYFHVTRASLATIHEIYYQGVSSTGIWCTIGGPVLPDGAFVSGCLFFPFHLPGVQVQYVTAAPNVIWMSSYGPTRYSLTGGQTDHERIYRPGQQMTEAWNVYPLHPQPTVQVLHGRLSGEFPLFPSAFRTGNTLTLSTTAFSDNYPGHSGTGFARGNGAKPSGSYGIYQNGTQIAHGHPFGQIPPVVLSPKPSELTFTLTASRQGKLFPLSSESTTTWTWRSERQPSATVPTAWACGSTSTGYQRHCAVQPMMTLNYQVNGLAPNGTTPPGPQTINLSVGHLELAKPTQITGAKADVSFDGGHTYQAATVTPEGDGQFRIGFTAPASADVTLRVSATDAAGSSISETILNAFGTSS